MGRVVQPVVVPLLYLALSAFSALRLLAAFVALSEFLALSARVLLLPALSAPSLLCAAERPVK